MRGAADLIKALRVPIAVTVTLLGLAAGLAHDAWSRIRNAEQAERTRETAVADLQRSANVLRDERTNAISFGPQFVELEALGAFEPHSRALMIDRFEALTEPWRSQVKRFELGTPGAAALPGVTEPTLHRVRGATLTFDLLPRHEGTFVDLVKALTDGMPGLHTLERCEIGWVSRDSDEALKASCTLMLYRFERRSDSTAVVANIGMPGMPGGAR